MTMQTIQTLKIRYDAFTLEIKIPEYFEKAPLYKIRKVFKLLKARPEQNIAANEQLGIFLSKWNQSTNEQHARLKTELSAAERALSEKRRAITVLGSTINENIACAESQLKSVKHLAKKLPSVYEQYRLALDIAKRPQTDYAQCVKTANCLISAINKCQRTIKRCEAVQDLYTKSTVK